MSTFLIVTHAKRPLFKPRDRWLDDGVLSLFGAFRDIDPKKFPTSWFGRLTLDGKYWSLTLQNTRGQESSFSNVPSNNLAAALATHAQASPCVIFVSTKELERVKPLLATMPKQHKVVYYTIAGSDRKREER